MISTFIKAVLLVFFILPFTAFSQTIFADDMSGDPEGRMPHYWHTHSVGEVVSIPEEKGKWLKMHTESTYQIDTVLALPPSFTLTFDLLTRSVQPADLRDLYFGFAKIPKTNSYLYGVVKDVTNVSTFLQFFYKKVRTKSNDTGLENVIDFPLENYGNALIPIKIEVDRARMRIYVDEKLVLDADALATDSPKYFFISNRKQRNNASVYFGNVKIIH